MDWFTSRSKERTSWDGAVLIACGLVILLAGFSWGVLVGVALAKWKC